MDHQPLTVPAAAASLSPSQGGKVLDAYKKALAAAASAAAYAVLARSMAQELLPDELRDAVRWGAAFLRARFGCGEKERLTIVIRRQVDSEHNQNQLFDAARAYLATRINPLAVRRLCLVRSRTKEHDGGSSWSTLLCMEPGGSTTDVFEGVEFTWTSVEIGDDGAKKGIKCDAAPRESLELSFDAEHTDKALRHYVPFILWTGEDIQRRDRALKIFMNDGRLWHGFTHHHPSTFGTLAMDPALKQSIVTDLDRFLKRKHYYRRIGKAWTFWYLLYGPPGTRKSSLVAAMANYLRFSLYDLDLSEVRLNSELQRLLICMPNKSILVIEDIDCCFDSVTSREGPDYTSDSSDDRPPLKGITLSGLLNFIVGLWSTCGEERIIVFTTNYKDRLDPALLRPGHMDMHIYMGYCGWEAFKTLAHNYFLIDDHPMFLEIHELLEVAEVTPAEVSEMLLRSEDADVALKVLAEFLQKKIRTTKKGIEDTKEEKAM